LVWIRGRLPIDSLVEEDFEVDMHTEDEPGDSPGSPITDDWDAPTANVDRYMVVVVVAMEATVRVVHPLPYDDHHHIP
jgi:hypothetical protein